MSIENITFREQAITPVNCISNGWYLAGQNYILFIAILVIGNFMSGCIPIIPLLRGPFDVGIYYAMLNQLKGEHIEFKMLFEGFRTFVPAVIVGLVIQIPHLISTGVALGFDIARYNEVLKPEELEPAQLKPYIIGFLIFGLFNMIVEILIRISFSFAIPLIAEYKLGALEALKLSFRAGWKNVRGIIILILLQTLIGIIGLLACVCGLFLVVPIIIAANILAYKQVFPHFAPSEQKT